jgi:hypothetical protein
MISMNEKGPMNKSKVCSVSVFVKSHWRLVKAAFRHISQEVNPNGTMLALLP